MKEVFYVLGHGSVQTAEVLDHRQRQGIPIIAMGTEGQLTSSCPSLLLISYYMKIHGNAFMNRLLTVLLEHGENYVVKFKPDDTKLEKDIRFLFDVNREDQKQFPQNVLRAYSGSARVLDTSLVSSQPNETFFYSAKLFHGTKHFAITGLEMESAPRSQYLFNETTFPNRDQFFDLVCPFGILKFDEQQRTFVLKHRLTQTVSPVHKVLETIRHQSKGIPIVFMVHCKSPDKKILMDFDFKTNPVEKFHKKSLTQMMEALTLRTKTPIIKRTAKKRKMDTTPTIPPTKRTKRTTTTTTTTPTKKRKITTTTIPPTKRTKTTTTTTKKRNITITPTTITKRTKLM